MRALHRGALALLAAGLVCGCDDGTLRRDLPTDDASAAADAGRSADAGGAPDARGAAADAARPRDAAPDGAVDRPDGAPRDAWAPARDAAPLSDGAPSADAASPADAAPPPDAAPPLDAEAPPDAAPPRCPSAAGCGLPPVDEHHIVTLHDCRFALDFDDRRAAADRVLAALGDGGRRVLPIEAVNLNREGRAGITADAADRLRNHPHEGFRWNDGDMGTTDWYPQGITGVSDARAEAGPPARRLFLVSWYDHRDVQPAKGVRVSLVDASDAGDIRYRHVLLAQPSGDSFGPVLTGGGGALHAGGIVWFGDWLYVADTTGGLRVFDLGRLLEVTDTGDRDRIGAAGGRIDAHAYRYVAFEIARYRLAADACPVRFSFAGLDRSARPPQIVTGEYHGDDALGRLVRWPVDPDSGWLQSDGGGRVWATDAAVGAQTRMQGALTWDGDTYISSSSQAGRLGRLYRTRPGLESRISAWVYGCEDLYYERHTDRIWTAAEHPDARDVVSIVRLPP